MNAEKRRKRAKAKKKKSNLYKNACRIDKDGTPILKDKCKSFGKQKAGQRRLPIRQVRSAIQTFVKDKQEAEEALEEAS